MSELLRLLSREPGALPHLLDRAGLGLYRAAPDGRLLWANAACLRLLGRQDASAGSVCLRSFFPTGDGAGGSREVRLRREDGADVWVRITEEARSSEEGRVVEGVMEDVTARVQAEETLRVLTRAVDTANLGVTVADPSGRILYTNPAEARMHGYQVEELIGRDVRVFAPQDLWKPMAVEGMREAGRWRRQSTNVNRDGELFPVEIASDVVRDHAGQPVALVSCSEDLTEMRRVQEELLRGALYDGLTELPNRTLFLDRLRHAVGRAARPTGAGVAVLFLDVDRFKVVNDSLGHQAGDELLQAIAQRLLASLRPGDTAARFGGDEFTVLLEGVASAAEATRAAERIQRALRAPVRVAGRDVVLTLSVGIAVGGGGGEPQFLLRDANLALHRAKALGNGARQVFDDGMHTKALALLQLETGLRRGMEREEFRVYFQPVVALDTGLLSGFEALVRWQDPQSGLVQPSDFVSVAEETGLIVPLDRWVLREACWQLVRWQELYPSQTGLSVSVNLSGRQFAHPDLVSRVDEILWETSLDPGQLRLEITESAIMENPQIAAAALAQLKERGIGLLLDDFGTGYSSLSYLYRLPIDTIKVDRSFVSGTGQGGNRTEITEAIITLAHQLGMKVVAEGVETPAQLRWLRDRGCELGQGYLFSPPLHEADARALYSATAWLNRRREA